MAGCKGLDGSSSFRKAGWLASSCKMNNETYAQGDKDNTVDSLSYVIGLLPL